MCLLLQVHSGMARMMRSKTGATLESIGTAAASAKATRPASQPATSPSDSAPATASESASAAKTKAPSSSGRGSGLLAAMQAADLQARHEFTPEQKQLLVSTSPPHCPWHTSAVHACIQSGTRHHA